MNALTWEVRGSKRAKLEIPGCCERVRVPRFVSTYRERCSGALALHSVQLFHHIACTRISLQALHSGICDTSRSHQHLNYFYAGFLIHARLIKPISTWRDKKSSSAESRMLKSDPFPLRLRSRDIFSRLINAAITAYAVTAPSNAPWR